MSPSASLPSPVLSIRRISKQFGDLLANDDLSLDLARGEILALLGENGAGKTTLMNILFGHYLADSGHIEVFGETLPGGRPLAAIEAGVGMVHQHFTLAENVSVWENIVLGTESLWRMRLRKAAAVAHIRELVTRFGLEVDPLAQVSGLSVGERQRVELLKALYRDARILILDEPTAVLTPGETEALFATLRGMVREGLAIIFISHKLGEVLAISDRIAVLRQGRLVASFHRDDADRAQLAQAMVGRAVAQPVREAIASGEPLLAVRGLGKDAGDAGPALHDISFELRGARILGIAGVSGNGQTTLAGVLSGVADADKGDLDWPHAPGAKLTPRALTRAGVGRIPEDRHAVGVIGDMSIAENMITEQYREPAFNRLGWLRGSKIIARCAELIDAYQIHGARAERPVRSLSGGNMQKVILARVLARQPKVIIAAQPTRGLDVGAAAYVHEQLLAARQRGAAILLVSEDLDELFALSDLIAVMYRGRMSEPMDTVTASREAVSLLMSGQGFGAAHAGDLNAA